MIPINERRVSQIVRSFERAMSAYGAKEPFARFLTQFFKENKQMGSSDRRMTSRLCYNYFRLGASLGDMAPLDRLVVAEFLCEQQSILVGFYKPEWTGQQSLPLTDKLSYLLTKDIAVEDSLFPLAHLISPAIDKDAFVRSHLVQPALFVRVKRNAISTVTQLLDNEGLAYTQLGPYTLAFENGSKVQQVKGLEGLLEVQDYSSQRTAELLQIQPGDKWWDACAASGGKALMLLDEYPQTNLLVSDIRLSILRNLEERFERAQMHADYRLKVIDLTLDPELELGEEQFDGILVDAPCTGSGTWGRTPELIAQFEEGKLLDYTALQRKIVSHVIPHVKSGGQLVYITCSVFTQENEAMVSYITENFGLTCEQVEVFEGHPQQADSMFAARFVKA